MNMRLFSMKHLRQTGMVAAVGLGLSVSAVTAAPLTINSSNTSGEESITMRLNYGSPVAAPQLTFLASPAHTGSNTSVSAGDSVGTLRVVLGAANDKVCFKSTSGIADTLQFDSPPPGNPIKVKIYSGVSGPVVPVRGSYDGSDCVGLPPAGTFTVRASESVTASPGQYSATLFAVSYRP